MLHRENTSASFIDILDRVLDKGIVIDAWVALSVIGINLVTVDARIVVASMETYFKHADAVARTLGPLGQRPPLVGGTFRDRGTP
jgi:gas vesicle structural protein